jgi:lupus La protein
VETKPEVEAEESKSEETKPEETKPEEAKPKDDLKAKAEADSKSIGNGAENPFSKKRKNYQENVKTDFTAQPETDDPDEIRKQVEFYFSDSNLPLDKFLYEQVGGSENNSVPIKVIHNFKRMRRFQPYSAVVAALQDSDILEVTDEEVKRKVPLPEAVGKSNVEDNIKIFEDKAQPRSIYAKGFGEEGPSTQFDIEAFFMPYGPTNAIRLRRSYPDKTFKGSVFVEFDCEETQQTFLALDPKPKWNGKELTIMSKKEYCEMKLEDIKAGRVKPNENTKYQQGNRDGRSYKGRGNWRKDDSRRDTRRRASDDENDRDEDDWKGRRSDFQKRDEYRQDDRDRNRLGGRSHRGHNDRRGHRDQKRQRDRNDEDDDFGRDKNRRKDHGQGRKDRKDEVKSSMKLDERGVPIVEDTSARAKPNGSSAPVGSKKEELSANGTKRAREDDTTDTDFADAKKTKVDAVDEGS